MKSSCPPRSQSRESASLADGAWRVASSLWLLTLAAFVFLLAAVVDLLRGPRQLQAVHAVVVARVAVVLAVVRLGGCIGRWEARGRGQLRGAALVGGLAAIELLLGGPAAHPPC